MMPWTYSEHSSLSILLYALASASLERDYAAAHKLVLREQYNDRVVCRGSPSLLSIQTWLSSDEQKDS